MCCSRDIFTEKPNFNNLQFGTLHFPGVSKNILDLRQERV